MDTHFTQAKSLTLSSSDIEHFAVHGYVVKRGLLARHEAEAAAATAWESMPEGFTPNPNSWRGKVSDCRGELDIDERYGLVKFRAHVHQHPILKAVSIRNDRLLGAAEQLLGHDRVAPPRRFRGIYPIFPTPQHVGTPVNAHLDVTSESFKLTYSVYLGDIPSRGGALTVWPGSHRLLHYACAKNSSNLNDINTKSFRRLFGNLNLYDPVEITGGAGDVIIMHYRLLHAASLNTIENHVRLALYFNVATNDATFAEGPPAEDIWDGWEGVNSVGSPVIEQTRERPQNLLRGWKKSEARKELLPWKGAWGGFAKSIHRPEGT